MESVIPITVLIVEDYKPDVKLVQKILEDGKLFLNTKNVSNGDEALSYLNKEEPKYKDAETPDLILLDIRMPVMDGHQLLQIIKKDEKFRRIPVIIMTISKDDDDSEKAYDEHVNAYIVKPIEYNQLVEAIRSLERFWFTVVKLPKRDD
jgi:two-component system response regulator